MKTLLLIDHRPHALQTLARVFEPHYRVVTAADAAQAAALLAGDERPDLVVLDVNTPGTMDLANQIRTTWRIPVILLSQATATPYKPSAIDGYAADLITRPFDFQELLVRVEAILSPAHPTEDLKATVRQVQVMKLMANGLSDAEIAERLTIVERTVRWHIYRAMHELEANSRPHLVNIAIKAGLISPE
jgi:DNA-binding NarL/FixJ family response regulator